MLITILSDDDIMKNIFNSGRNKNKVGMRIPPWMITEEMKLTEHYKMYAEVFGLDVPMIHLAEQKSHEEQEARENMALVAEHLAAEEIEKLVEESENDDDSSPTRHDDTSIPGTRIELRSDKESPEVEIVQEKDEETSKDTEVEPNIVIPVNVDDEDDEITDEVFELRRMAKGKNVEESRISPIPSPTRSPRNLSTLVSPDTKKLQELTVTRSTPSSGSSVSKITKTNRLLRNVTYFAQRNGSMKRKSVSNDILKKRFMPQKLSDQLANNLHDVMMETLPSLVKEKVTKQVEKEVPAQVRNQVPVYLAKGLIMERKTSKEETERLISKAILQERGRMQDDPHDDAHPEGENSAKRQKSSEYEAYVSIESSSRTRDKKEPGRPKEEIYSNSKIVQVIKTFWELGHEHKFITEIVARRANYCIVSITEPDYKNLNKNDIEEMYMLIMNNKKINLTAPTITFLGIEECDVFSIVYEPVHGIIYTNSKKEKRVIRPSEIHKFCDATLRRTLEGIKSYYNDVKYGYVQKELTNDELEFLKLFEEEIEVRLKYRDQIRRWEMYVNGRPLGPRRERKRIIEPLKWEIIRI
ncbi:hypothetical protein Tco_1275081 [Tanacetum coccineum]